MTSTHETSALTQQKQTVAETVAATVSEYTSEVFTLMGNGNAYFVDALKLQNKVRLTALRHETGTVASADAYYRITRQIACASTTFGPGFTNAVTSLAEAVCSRTPMVAVVGDAPTSGPRPWDIDQRALVESVGAISMTVAQRNPARSVREAFETALSKRLPVVLGIPHDTATAVALDAESDESSVVEVDQRLPEASSTQIHAVAHALRNAERPLILAGRGAAQAATDLGVIADQIGALTASSAPARGSFAGRQWDLGVCGGFASEASSQLIQNADVVLVVGASLNQFTTAFGHQFASDAHIIQIDIADDATSPLVSMFIQADARATAESLRELLEPVQRTETRWNGTADHAHDSSLNFARPTGDRSAPDGLLDPRSAMVRLNEILPKNRQVISDGGHFIGWSSYYFDLPSPDSLVMVGTQFQSIGLGLPSATGAALARPERTHIVVAGDGGAIMGIADLDGLVRSSKSAAVIIFNDGCYGAEIHQYGSQGLDTDIMEIDQADFVKLGEGFGATGAVIRELDDLEQVEKWVEDGARGTFIIDLRISRNVVAPYIEEIVELTIKK